jgi:hypothetical protein
MSGRDANKKPVGSHERKGIKAEMEVPVNLERVLLEAAQDPAFYQSLIKDRSRALVEKGFRLRPSEQAMLSALPQLALDKMIERLVPDKLKKSSFAKHVVTALAGSLIISTSACGTDLGPTKGVSPDWPIDGGSGTSGAAGRDSGSGGTGGVFTTTPPATTGTGPSWPAGSGGVSGAGRGGNIVVTKDAGAAGTGIGPGWPAGAGGKSGSGGESGASGTSGSSGASGSSGVSGSDAGSSGIAGAVTRGISPDWPSGSGQGG